MPGEPVFPSFTRIEHQPNPQAEAAFVAEVDKILGNASRKMSEFSAQARETLDQALSVSRNSVGSLDLGTDQIRAAAQAQQQRAVAAREVYEATLRAAQAEGQFSQQSRLTVAATKALWQEEERAASQALAHARALEAVQAELNKTKSQTDLVASATRTGTTAQQNVINSARASRVAYVQLGQQMQDVVIQAQLGTNAFQIFAQQIPQAAFALSGLANSAGRTERIIGKFATFMSGPWGAAIFAATAVLGPLVAKMFESSDAAEQSARSNRTLVQVLDDTTSSYEEVRQALDDYNRSKEKEHEVTILALADQARSISQNLNEAIAIREKTKALLDNYDALRQNPTVAGQSGPGLSIARQIIAGDLEKQDAELKRLRDAAANVTISIADSIAKIQSEPETKIKTGFEVLRDEARKTITDVDALAERLTQLNLQEKAALDSLRGTSKARSDAFEASLGDMVALTKQLFPGARITSTTGGKHKAGSDHYAGRAIDFVPAGGMGQYTVDEVRQILEDAGVDIRRNAKGTEQLFGPGKSASKPGDHNDHFHFAWQGAVPDPEKVQAALKRSEDLLKQFGERASENVQRINERFNEQPTLIDQAAQATRQLDELIAQLQDKQPPDFEKTIASAEEAKKVIAEALERPFRDLNTETERNINLQKLVLSGREEEAAVLQEIYRLERELGPLTAAQKDEVAQIVGHEYEINKALEKRKGIINEYLSATQSIRSELEGFFAGEGLPKLGKIFKELQSKILVENLFGPALDELDEFVKGKSGIKASTDYLTSETSRAGESVSTFADAVEDATRKITAAPAALGSTGDMPTSSDLAAFNTALSGLKGNRTGANGFGLFNPSQRFGQGYDPVTGTMSLAGNDNGQSSTDIVVERSILGLTPEQYFDEMTKKLVGPALEGLDQIFGVKFFSGLSGVLSGALYGSAVGGTPGGILGAIKGIEGLPEGLSKALDTAIGGTATGTMVAGLADSLGINLSNTGAQIGGAIGSMIPIPGGDIIGAIAGGIIGKLVAGHKKGFVSLNGVDITSTYGTNETRLDAANNAAGSIIDSIANIADQLGGTINSANGAVSIGMRDNSYRVDPTGQNKVKLDQGAIDFGEDQAAAIRYAILDLIKDGVIEGLRDSTLRLLQEGDDLEAAIQKAMDFESVFTRLKAYKDPIGAAIDEVDKEFDRLRQIFEDAGASAEEYAQLEELYGIERADAIKQATEAMVGSLRSLLDDLTVNNSALSLRERESMAKADYQALAARVAAGDTTAYDDFATAARTLLDIEREIYGSQQPYFDLLSEVTSLTQQALDAAEGRSDPSSTSAVPANDNTAIVTGIDTTNSHLSAMNQNLITLITLQQSGGSSTAAGNAYVSNF